MRTRINGRAFQDLERLFRHGVTPSDGALLARFVSERSESAFESIVGRHGPMVLGVCRRILPDTHDADDAFQATFLVLVRKAGSLRDPDRLGPWLYGVATRIATRARQRAGRRKSEPLSETADHRSPSGEWSDLRPILDSELARLPARQRAVLIICLLEGASAEEASRRLDCPLGTVKSRLARGRAALRLRLVRRGITPALAALPAPGSLVSPVPATLLRATLHAIAAPTVAPGIAALAQGATAIMLSKSTLAAGLVLGGLGVTGLGLWSWSKPTLAQAPPETPQAKSRSQQEAHLGNKLKSIGLALQNYLHDNDDHFPAPVIYGTDGLPKLSWRVALLPYLNQRALYEQFHLDEPWDSPHNKALIDRMPDVFKTPGLPTEPGETRIRAFAGRGAVFDGPKATSRAEITDGTSNTMFATVAEESTPWTKPGELPFVPGKPLPALAESSPRGHLMCMLDGSVRVLLRSDANATFTFLSALITRAGGEILPSSVVPPLSGATERQPEVQPGPVIVPPLPSAASMPSMSSNMGMMGEMMMGSVTSNPQSLEQRLQRVEEKLDQILEILKTSSNNSAFNGGGAVEDGAFDDGASEHPKD